MADNKVIRTTVLEVITYIPATGYFVVQKATGTYKVSWHTIVASLTASLPPPS